MESPEHKELERFIHEQLRKLPEHEAPADLVQNVFKVIAAREHQAWWKQPFTYWPRRNQMLLFTALILAFSGAVYLTWGPAEHFTAGSLLERIRPFGWVTAVAETILGSLILAVRSMPWQWMAGIAVVFMTMRGLRRRGLALYRTVSQRSLRLF